MCERRRYGAGVIVRGENVCGGEVGIRTLDSLTTITVFETAAFDHSATSPRTRNSSTALDLESVLRSIGRDGVLVEKLIGAIGFAAVLGSGAAAAFHTPVPVQVEKTYRKLEVGAVTKAAERCDVP